MEKIKIKNFIKKNIKKFDDFINNNLALLFLLSIVGICLPAFFDYHTESIYMKILLIAGSIYSTIVIIGLYYLLLIKHNFKLLLNIIELFLLLIISCLFYNISTELKLNIIKYIVAVIILLSIIENSISIAKSVSKEMFIQILLIIGLILTFFGLIILEANSSQSITLLKIGLGFILFYFLGYLISIYILNYDDILFNKIINKLKILSKNISENKLTHTLFKLLILIIVIFGIPIYLQFCGIDGDFFDNFLLIYSSIIGGLITLAGVSWTIKDAENNRKKDEENREKERHAEDIKKYMPYLIIKQLDLNIKHELLDLEHIDISILDNNNYTVNFNPLFLKNSDNSNIIIKKISIDNLDILIEKFLEKNDYLLIKFPIIHKDNFTIIFEVSDLIGNIYYYELRYYKLDYPTNTNFEVNYTSIELKSK